MSIDYETEYNNQRRVPAIATLAPQWGRRSTDLRANTRSELDISYGSDPRQRYDIFYPDGATDASPVAVFIHGGYWQARDRKDFSFVVGGCLAHGVVVAMPSYRLCPQVRIADIVADMQSFMRALFAKLQRRAVVTGHSAGGHLTAALLATDWSAHRDVPHDLVRTGYAISGVFDVVPLVETSLNTALGETVSSARSISPMFGPPPPLTSWLTAAVGGDESTEFIRQSVDFAGVLGRAGVPAEAVVVPAVNHFTILEELARPNSAMVLRIVDMARRAAS